MRCKDQMTWNISKENDWRHEVISTLAYTDDPNEMQNIFDRDQV